ncbi:MAG TPA: sigma-54 dependent transcriptional regulator [Candidatus Eisenbacteria bacterium]|nr:sigma-54 dependent transcriptional regulator [Candidatus Eisenbacteria bacterium]
MSSLLIVDDEANIRSSLQGALGREGYHADVAGTLAEARERLRESRDVVLLDVLLPDGSGLDLLAEIAAHTPETVVVVMSGHATIDVAVEATRRGAFDFMEKPISLERLLVVLRNATATQDLEAENRRLRRPWALPLVGRSSALRSVEQMIEAAGRNPVARVLIEGEHGTGKELVARAIHAAGPRRARPFVAVNCSAIPEDLFESEMFGHERGAFTGATQARRGRFEEAHGGTLFLDEVADLSLRGQAKLLRVLQEKEVTRVGGNRLIAVDVAVVAATNRDLRQRIAAEQFREDLYYRLAGLTILVPPLRERAEDIAPLVEHFAARFAKETGIRVPRFAPPAIEQLARYSFPGNVRELHNVVERLLMLHPGSTIGAEQIRGVLHATAPSSDRTPVPAGGRRLAEAVQEFEKKEIEAALESTEGNMTQAASRLGLERSHLYKKMRKLGLRPESWGNL